MNKKTIVIAAGVIGLIGLGLLIHYLHNQSADATDYVPSTPRQPAGAKKPPLHKAPNAPVSKPVQSKTKPVATAVKQNPVQSKPVSQVQVEKSVAPPIADKPKANLPVGDEFPLRLGSQGPRVERVQVYLMRNFGRTGKVNGIFDEQTEAQVKKRFHTTHLDENTYQKYRMGKHVNEQVIIR